MTSSPQPSRPIDIPHTYTHSHSPRSSASRLSDMSEDSYIYDTFYAFKHHARACPSCEQPLQVHLSGRQLCRQGHKLARSVAKALYEEADQQYKRSRGDKRKDGWQSVNIEIPQDCKVIRELLVAMDRGLQLHYSVKKPNITSSKDARYLNPDHYDRHYTTSSRMSHSSDEDLFPHSLREDIPRSMPRQNYYTYAPKPKAGVEERERRPYTTGPNIEARLSSSMLTEGSTDSGYDTAPHSPDFRRGSQFAEDMRRRQKTDRPKSILKPSSYENKQLDFPNSRTGRSSGVGFNIDGQLYVPGFN